MCMYVYVYAYSIYSLYNIYIYIYIYIYVYDTPFQNSPYGHEGGSYCDSDVNVVTEANRS